MEIQKLIGTRIIIEEKPPETDSGIILPHEQEQQKMKVGKVLHVGHEVNTAVDTGVVKEGDAVLYQFGFDAFPPLGEDARIGNVGSIIAVVK